MGIPNYCVTKYPKLGNIEQQQFILSEFTSLEVQIGGVGKIGSFRKAQRESLFMAFCYFLVLPEILGVAWFTGA